MTTELQHDQAADAAQAAQAAPRCPNCDAPAPGRYCAGCGQRQGEHLVSLRRMIADALDDHFAINAQLPRTLIALCFRPGHLTREYAAGRIVRYIRPFRLYLVCSIAFFVSLSLTGDVRRLLLPEAEGETPPPAAVDEDAVGRDAAPAPVATAAETPTAPPADGGTTHVEAAGSAGTDAARGDAGRVPQISIRLPDTDTSDVPAWLRPIEEHARRREARFEGMSDEQRFRLLISNLERDAPKAAFLLLPVFALLLKVLYFRRGRYYVEHFVFALHSHAFAFLAFALMLVLPGTTASGLIFLWLAVYLFWAMKRVYGQGLLATGMKYSVLGFAYSIVVLLVFVAVALVAAFTA